MTFNALWWWIDRWRKSTAYTDMTLEQQGAYRNLLDEANLRGGAIPDDDRILSKACGDARAWKRVKGSVLSRFELHADGWHNPTLDEVLVKSQELSAKRAESGKQGAASRWNHGKPMANGMAKPMANGIANPMAKPCPPSPSPSPSPEKDLQPLRSEDLPVRARELSPSEAPELSERAARFTERYASLFARFRNGAKYHNRPHLDHMEAMGLVAIWDDTRLDELAEAFLTTNDAFCRNGSGTIAQFRSRASWCDAKLREKGL